MAGLGRLADRHAVVAVTASIVMICSAGYVVAGAVMLDDLQVRWNQRGGSFGYVSMLNGGVVEVCNPGFLPLAFQSLSMSVSYRGQDVGEFVTGAAAVPSGSERELAGDGRVADAAGRMFSMYVDTKMSGTDVARRVDSGQVDVLRSVEAPVLGFIPWSVTKTYSGQEFFDMMDGGGDYGC